MLSLRDRNLLRKPNLMEKEIDQRVVIAADEKSQTHPTPLETCFRASKFDFLFNHAILA